MKKIKYILLVVVLTIVFVCSGCTVTGLESYERHTKLKETGIENLYYDPDTKIVYMMFSEASGYQGYGYMTVYIAGNGKPYKWENGLKEIP